MRFIIASMALFLCHSALAAPAQVTVAVPDFQVVGASERLAATLSGMVATELDRAGIFRIFTAEMIRNLLSLEREKQLLGCADDSSSCTAELAGALGTEFLLTGRLSEVRGAKGPLLTLELTLLNVAKATPEGSDMLKAASEAELAEQLAPSVIRLIRKLVNERSGFLIARVSESGAAVKIDDVLVGTTPLGTALPVPAGRHFVAIEKEGFVTYRKEIQTAPEQTVEHTFTLMPSPDFVNAYEARAKRMRVGAWATTTLAAAGIASGIYFRSRADAHYGDPGAPGTFLYLREQLRTGEAGENAADVHGRATQLRNQIQDEDRFSTIGFAAGALSGIAAAYFWIAGDDPARYRGEAGPNVTSVSLVPGGPSRGVAVGGVW